MKPYLFLMAMEKACNVRIHPKVSDWKHIILCRVNLEHNTLSL